jgi:aspartokinase/homoserine dehydrogenase 1
MALIRLQGSGMVGVAGIAMRLFRCLAQAQVNVVLITQASSEHTICIAIQEQYVKIAEQAINQEFQLEQRDHQIEPAIIETGLAIVSIVGEQMRSRPGISGKVFGALGRNGINIVAIAQGSSELNISAVIREEDEQKALSALHDEFFQSKNRTVNIFLAGRGLVGSTLLKQVNSHKLDLLRENQIELKVISIANTQGVLASSDKSECLTDQDSTFQAPPRQEPLAANHSTAESEKQSSEQLGSKPLLASSASPITQLLAKALELNLPNSVFVDCTASDEVAEHYEHFLKASVAVVTSNKRAQSGPINSFNRLRELARDRRVSFLYETSVGAGLPVISTLRDLRNSGDTILKIEAVLSGTLSYLFNGFDGSRPFSEMVKEAQKLGYTEPDPREDLSGLDVARKILILARECGASLELAEVKLHSLVPEECRGKSSVADFYQQLAQSDQQMEGRAVEANRVGRRLCYIASYDGSEARVELKEIDQTHPFFLLKGSDNIISFATDRYRERPLVVKGPGAGAEVTAAGVLADVVRIASNIGV